jgi:hypothetical protein
MKIVRAFLIFVIAILILSCYKPIPKIYSADELILYNEGTAWKMPGYLKVSDFYYDIESIYEYEGEDQPYRLKLKSFFWQDETDENHTIESAFFIVKSYATGGSFDYAFEYRRYDILANEVPPDGEIYPDKIRDLWRKDGTEIQRGSALYLTNSNNERFIFGMPHRRGWSAVDGLYETYSFSMFFAKEYDPILSKILNEATVFRFYFPSSNSETNGYKLDHIEQERLITLGKLVELDNNSFSLSKEELEKLKTDLNILMRQKKKEPSEYIEQIKKEILK